MRGGRLPASSKATNRSSRVAHEDAPPYRQRRTTNPSIELLLHRALPPPQHELPYHCIMLEVEGGARKCYAGNGEQQTHTSNCYSTECRPRRKPTTSVTITSCRRSMPSAVARWRRGTRRRRRGDSARGRCGEVMTQGAAAARRRHKGFQRPAVVRRRTE